MNLLKLTLISSILSISVHANETVKSGVCELMKTNLEMRYDTVTKDKELLEDNNLKLDAVNTYRWLVGLVKDKYNNLSDVEKRALEKYYYSSLLEGLPESDSYKDEKRKAIESVLKKLSIVGDVKPWLECADGATPTLDSKDTPRRLKYSYSTYPAYCEKKGLVFNEYSSIRRGLLIKQGRFGDEGEISTSVDIMLKGEHWNELIGLDEILSDVPSIGKTAKLFKIDGLVNTTVSKQEATLAQLREMGCLVEDGSISEKNRMDNKELNPEKESSKENNYNVSQD